MIGRTTVFLDCTNKPEARCALTAGGVVRQLIGTGLVEFVGGLLTAAIALGVFDSHERHDDGYSFLDSAVFDLDKHGFQDDSPDFRARPK